MSSLPTGTVTFLFTDIEGSTTRWEHHPRVMKAAVERHDAILRQAVEMQGGAVFRTEGDAFRAVFTNAPQALAAALQAQRDMAGEPWAQEVAPMRVRMALYTGAVELRDGDYVGPSLNRMARLLSVAHGGQMLLALATGELLRDSLPLDVTLRDMGEHRLKDLILTEHVYQVVVPDLPSDFPPLNSLDARANNLPVEPTPLVGREKEVATIGRLLEQADVRLLTLIGPGGIGKTRLAMQAAAEALDTFRDGVFFVNLAAVTDASLVPATVAQTLGVREAGGQPILQTLGTYLQNRQLLLVMDNFEQLVEAAPVVSHLLQASPQLKVLITSRSLLHLRGEKTFPVPPLTLPDPKHVPPLDKLAQYEAIRLFMQRAVDAQPDFELREGNAAAVAEICHRLDGLPLALELAAARINILTPQAILQRLESSLRLLTGGARDLPARQQTLRNTIEWSYDLLSEAEKKLTRRLGVFAGSTLESVEAVCNWEHDPETDTLDVVGSLVDKSLLRQSPSIAEAGRPRFYMLETIREYALERLEESGETEETRRRYADFFLKLTEETSPELFRPEQKKWLEQLKEELDNIRAVLAWSWERVAPGGDVRDPETGARVAVALYWFWYLTGYLGEGREWFGKALAGTDSMRDTPTRGMVLFGAGAISMFNGDSTPARRWLEEGIAIWRKLGDKEFLAQSLFMMGVAAVKQGDEPAAMPALQECLLLLQELGEQRTTFYSMAVLHIGDVALNQGDYPQARSRYEECLALKRETGDVWGVAQTVNNLGEVARCEADYERAEGLYNEALELFKDLGSPLDIARSVHNLAYVGFHRGDPYRATELFTESLRLYSEQLNTRGISECLMGLAGVACAQGKTGVLKAVRLLSAAEAHFEVSGTAVWPADRIEYEDNLARARAQLREEIFQSEWREGRSMNTEDAMNYALERGLS